ncbi:hypothetical protein V8E51_020028 [Hyaloscypha variabilis]
MPLKKASGRPRKYSTVEEARRANLEGPADFIAYKPQLYADILVETPLETGLSEVRPNLRPSPRPNPQPPTAEDAEINEQVRRVQTREQETDTEQAERDVEIVEILLRIQAAEQTEDASKGDTATRAKKERISEEDDIDEPILGDKQSIATSHTSNRLVNIQRLIEGRVPLEALARYALPSLQSLNKSSSKKGATPATPIRASVPAISASPAPTKRTQITALLSRGYISGTPLPNVLSSPKLIRPGDYNAAPEDVRTRNENLPKNLYLSQHHIASRKNRRPNATFDIDSTCCFPTSLAFARRGINWMPKAHPILNLAADIHFGLQVPKYTPFYKIPHYYFSTVVGMDSLSILIFFPALHLESDYKHSTYLSKEDEQLYLDSTAILAEGLARKQSARDALLYDYIPEDYEAEAYAASQVVLNTDGSHAKGSPKRTIYPWATMRDTVGQTMFASLYRQESRDGLIYSQFYGLIKTPFDSSKNLALDPGYVRLLYYFYNKKRAYANLWDLYNDKINKYYFLFEHTIIIVAVLRALRFYYGKQGLGMRDIIERYSLAPLYRENILRRWRAVKDLRDFDRYNFDADRCPELTLGAVRRMFRVDGVPSPPHFVTGNKIRFKREDNKERAGWDEFFYLTSRTQGLKGRIIWFSAVYTNLDRDARQQAFGNGRDQPYRAQGLKIYRFLLQIKKKSLDELKDLISRFSRDVTSNNIQDDPSDASGGEIGASAVGDGDDRSQSRSTSTSRSIITIHDNGGQESVSRESASTPITMSSGSIFIPSI